MIASPTTASLLAKKRCRMSDHWLTLTTLGSAPCLVAAGPAPPDLPCP